MPVSGRKPKPAGQARHRVPPTHDWVEVENVPFGDGPALPELRPDGRPWSRRTAEKWDVWRGMPHCKLWGLAEWDFALDSIEVAAKFHETSDMKFATELRNREKVLGTTNDYRRDLRIRYVEPVVNDAPAEVARMDDYRNL